MAWAVRGRSSPFFGKSVYHGVRSRPAIALTFDDGPSESTPEILDILEKSKVPATFFLCGANVRRLPDVARQVAGKGHEIGNHSDTHEPFWLRKPAFIHKQVRKAQETIQAATGITPVLFRVPYGVRWFGLGGVQRELGLTGVMWTTNGQDWRLPADKIFERLRRGARNGSIFCLHDARENIVRPDIKTTIEALRRLLPVLTAMGYHFERVSQILCPTI